MTSNPAAPAGTSNWCDDMITWMRQQIGGDWEGWMMNGSIMGR